MRITRITKVKYDGAKVRIEYQQKRVSGGDPDEYLVQSSDRPRPEFIRAMNDLAGDVVGICELAVEDMGKLTVRGVTITWTNDIMGACITALKALKGANAPLVLNTPHLPSEPYSEGGADFLLPDETRENIAALLNEAEAYIRGERAQGSLLPEVPATATETAARRLEAVGFEAR